MFGYSNIENNKYFSLLLELVFNMGIYMNSSNTTSPAKKNFLNNKDLLAEIQKSKISYSEFDSPDYQHYDFIVTDLSQATRERITQARQKKADELAMIRKRELVASGIRSPVVVSDINAIPEDSIVFRLMTYDHIPMDPEKEGRAKTVKDAHMRCNFPPFQHWIFRDPDYVCVGRSHTKNGEFSITHGKMTNKLALMFIKLVDKYGHRGNWRNYCVDTETQAMTQRGWLNIDEINESDMILSCNNNQLVWSSIKSIYRGHHDGLMHYLSMQGFNALVTPNHKMLTPRGLVEVEAREECTGP